MQEIKEKNNDVFAAMENTLIENCPGGFGVNPKALKGIAKGLIRTHGICPCTHEEWDENTPREDKLCPCKTFCETLQLICETMKWSKQDYKCGDCAFWSAGKCEIIEHEVSAQKNACRSFEG